MSKIDHVQFLNLDHRTDRRAQIEAWLEESGFPQEKITRVSAYYLPGRGHLGCTISHIQALKAFLDSSHNTCCIFEDDYLPENVTEFWKTLDSYLSKNIPFDMLMLAQNMLTSTPTEQEHLEKVYRCFTSSGYVITREFAPKLLENLQEGLNHATQQEATQRQKANDYCLDVYWEKLMPSSKWFAIVPRMGKQCESQSDIEQKVTNQNA